MAIATARTRLILFLSVALAGCGAGDPAAEHGATVAAVTVAAMPPDELRVRADEALASRRYFVPRNGGAVDFLLALRDGGRGTPGDAAALADLQPYLVIAIEQTIERRDVAEARRLLELLARIDSAAPALPRLTGEITAAERAVADATSKPLQAPASTPDAPRSPAEPNSTVAAPRLADTPALPHDSAPAGRDPTPRALSEAVADSGVTAAPASRPNDPVAANPPDTTIAQPAALRLVRDVLPRYPARALARRVDGKVELAFTVQPDGSIANIRVVAAQPGGVFDDAAVAAARRWRFAPVATARDTTRTLSFTPPSG